MEPLLLSTEDAAAALGLHPATLRHWACGSKRAPPGMPMPVKVGRLVRWRYAELAAFASGAAQQTTAPAPPAPTTTRRVGRPRKLLR